jgi:hypothetical protein
VIKPSIKGRAVIWGVRDVCPIVNIPPDALDVQILMRPNAVAVAFVRFTDRTEEWIIEPAGGLLNCKEWKLGWRAFRKDGEPASVLVAALKGANQND